MQEVEEETIVDEITEKPAFYYRSQEDTSAKPLDDEDVEMVEPFLEEIEELLVKNDEVDAITNMQNALLEWEEERLIEEEILAEMAAATATTDITPEIEITEELVVEDVAEIEQQARENLIVEEIIEEKVEEVIEEDVEEITFLESIEINPPAAAPENTPTEIPSIAPEPIPEKKLDEALEMLKSDEHVPEEDINEIIVGEQLVQFNRKPPPKLPVKEIKREKEQKEVPKPPKKSFFRRIKEKVVVYLRKLTLADIRFIGEDEED